jgi:flagellar motor protein MotB
MQPNSASRTRPDEGDENYFISTTDMLVGILFIFIIMLMAFALNYKDAQHSRQKQVADVRSAIETVQREVKELQQLDRQRAELLRQLQERLRANNVRVHIEPGSGVLRLPEDLLFDRNKADLNRNGQQALEYLAKAMEAVLPCFTKSRPPGCSVPPDIGLDAVYIEGHTDRSGAEEFNWRLSADRAISTYRKLQLSSPSTAELENAKGQRLLGVSGYAYYRLAEPDQPLDSKNRRIDIRFTMSVSYEAALERIRRQLQQMLLEQ